MTEITKDKETKEQRHKYFTWKSRKGKNHGNPQTPNSITMVRGIYTRDSKATTLSSPSLGELHLVDGWGVKPRMAPPPSQGGYVCVCVCVCV